MNHIHKRKWVLASVMVAMFLAAIEATIVSTAMPSIVAELGGFRLYSWVFSAYLLTNAATVLLFGRVADVFGRKPAFLIGIIIFLVGAIACALAPSMKFLIAGRFIQGIGAGAIMPIATTIVGDMYTKEERAKIQGYLSSVWGISAVFGPLLGGFFVEVLSWPYVFWMNIPLGLLALAGVCVFFKESPREEKRKIDGTASLWLVLSISGIMYVLVEGGVGIPWLSWPMGTLIAVSVLSVFLFIRNERKSPDPMVPLHLWSIKSIRYANLTSFTTGMILIGVSSYLPAFVQGVMGQSPTVAGFTLTTLSIGWPIASTFAGRLFLSIGFRATSILGGVSLLIGGFLFTLLSPEHGPWFAATASFFIGVGMGLASTSFIVSIQNTVKWESRGIATATNMFMRTIGSALGAALLGGLLNGQIQEVIQASGNSQELTVNDANLLLQETGKDQLGAEAVAVLKEGLTSGLNLVYTGLFIVALISFILILRLPKNED